MDLTGKRFGRWSVIEKIDDASVGAYRALWKCRCDCGTERIMQGKLFMYCHSASCGCYKKELLVSRVRKHGMSNSKVYRTWTMMISRCEKSYNVRHEQYSKRGITVCDEWKNSFYAFYDYVSKLEHFNEDGYSLDRIDNDKGYEPGNVRWADAYTQMNNTSKNRYIEINGVIKTLSQWARIYNIKYHTVLYRLNNGWSSYKALTTPVGRYGK